MLAFDDYVRARGPALVRLGYALSGNPRVAKELALEALVRARKQWPRIHEQPDEPVEQELVQAYLSWWRRPLRPHADHPLATLGRLERAVLALRHYHGLPTAQIADAVGRSGTTVRHHLEAHQVDKAALTEFVDAMYPPEGLVEGVKAKSEALARKRKLIGVGAAVVVLASAGIFGATRPTPVVPPPDPAPTATPSREEIRLVPASFALPHFPYEPTFLPYDPGPPRVHKTARDLLLEYSDISISLTPREPGYAGTPELIEINGQRAKVFSGIFSGNLDLAIVWQMDNQWFAVHTFNVTQADAVRIAGGLRPGRVAMDPPPFTITIAPEGFDLVAANSEQLCIGRGTTPVRGAYGVCVNLAEPGTLPSLPANTLQRTTVNGLRVEVADFEGTKSELRLFLEDGRMLQVSQNALTPSSKLSADELVRFAAAVRINPPQA